jgi:hypothetical protein
VRNLPSTGHLGTNVPPLQGKALAFRDDSSSCSPLAAMPNTLDPFSISLPVTFLRRDVRVAPSPSRLQAAVLPRGRIEHATRTA